VSFTWDDTDFETVPQKRKYFSTDLDNCENVNRNKTYQFSVPYTEGNEHSGFIIIGLSVSRLNMVHSCSLDGREMSCIKVQCYIGTSHLGSFL
jgi:hypothetical protein